MNPRRIKRVESLIQRELNDIILKEVNDPRLGLITITGVKVTTDLKNCWVYYSVYGDENVQKLSSQILSHQVKRLRYILAQRIKLRRIPFLNFSFDSTVQKAFRIEKIFNEIQRGHS